MKKRACMRNSMAKFRKRGRTKLTLILSLTINLIILSSSRYSGTNAVSFTTISPALCSASSLDNFTNHDVHNKLLKLSKLDLIL